MRALTMRSHPLAVTLPAVLLLAVASARADRRLRTAIRAGDDDAVGDDDAAFQTNAGSQASPNPYLTRIPQGNTAHNPYANLDGPGGFHDTVDGACHLSPAKSRATATACYAIAMAHSQMRCSLCVAPKLPHPCKGVDAMRFCAKLQKDLPHTTAPLALRSQRNKRRKAAEAATKQAHAAEAERATKAKQKQKQRALAKALAAKARAGGGLLQPGARSASGKDDTAYKKLDSRCRRAIVAHCAANTKRGRKAQLHTLQQCTNCAAHLPGAEMSNCRNAQEAKYLCASLVKQFQNEMKTERNVKFRKRAAAEKETKYKVLHGGRNGLPAHASAAGLARDLGKPFNSRDGLAGTENTHFRPYGGFKQGYGEMAACVLDRSEGIYDTFQTVGTCTRFTEKKGWDCYAYRASDLVQDLRFCCSGGEHVKSGAAEQMCKAAILPVLQPIETTVVPLFKKCTHKPADCERWRKMFAQCLDMREGMQHIMDKSYVCQQTLQKVLMPILQKAIDGARMLYDRGSKSDITKRAKQYMKICPKQHDAGTCSHIAALAHFQEKFDEAQLNPWDN